MTEASPEVPPEIVEHYETIEEGRRITEGLGRLELLRTREVLRRHLPRGPMGILDVGGATGVHAQWLAADGHHVHVVDLVPVHVEQAGVQPGSAGRVTAEVGDARNLPVPDGSFDAALVFGPLYHLTERGDRLLALREAGRAVRPGGMIFVAAISRFASLFDGLARGFLFDPSFRGIVDRDLAEGQHRNPTGRPEWFTTAYFHHPHELCEEAEAAGLVVVEMVGVEGLAGWLSPLEERLDSETDRDTVLFSARVVEAEPALLGLSAHLILVARTRS
jgi:SAM-dependent methyltransferase